MSKQDPNKLPNPNLYDPMDPDNIENMPIPPTAIRADVADATPEHPKPKPVRTHPVKTIKLPTPPENRKPNRDRTRFQKRAQRHLHILSQLNRAASNKQPLDRTPLQQFGGNPHGARQTPKPTDVEKTTFPPALEHLQEPLLAKKYQGMLQVWKQIFKANYRAPAEHKLSDSELEAFMQSLYRSHPHLVYPQKQKNNRRQSSFLTSANRARAALTQQLGGRPRYLNRRYDKLDLPSTPEPFPTLKNLDPTEAHHLTKTGRYRTLNSTHSIQRFIIRVTRANSPLNQVYPPPKIGPTALFPIHLRSGKWYTSLSYKRFLKRTGRLYN